VADGCGEADAEGPADADAFADDGDGVAEAPARGELVAAPAAAGGE
jgi:hypothetical protein